MMMMMRAAGRQSIFYVALSAIFVIVIHFICHRAFYGEQNGFIRYI